MREHHAQAVVVLGYNDLGQLRVILWCRRHCVPCFLFGDSNIRGDTVSGLKRVAKNAIVILFIIVLLLMRRAQRPLWIQEFTEGVLISKP